MSDQSQEKPLDGKTALITGASRGIGAATALECARQGAHVVLIARTVGGLEEVDDQINAAGGNATLMPLNLLKLDDLDKIGPTLAERFGGLDYFIGNAGMLGTLGPLAHAKAREWEQVMMLNVHANFRLIRTLDPLLQNADAGRALFITSGMAELNDAYWGTYATTKAALNAMVKTYAAETAQTNLRVNLFSPGPTETKMLKDAYPGGYQGEIHSPETVAKKIVASLYPNFTLHGQIIETNDLKIKKAG